MNYNFTLEKGLRDKMLRIVTEDEFRKEAEGTVFPFWREFGTKMEEVPYKEIVSYAKKKQLYHRDEICKIFLNVIEEKIRILFPEAEKIERHLKRKEYRELTEKDLKWLEQFRESYEKTKMPISFDDYVKYSCFPDLELLLDTETELFVRDMKIIECAEDPANTEYKTA